MFIIGGILGAIAGVCLIGITEHLIVGVLGKTWITGFIQMFILLFCWFSGCVLFEIIEDIICALLDKRTRNREYQ